MDLAEMRHPRALAPVMNPLAAAGAQCLTRILVAAVAWFTSSTQTQTPAMHPQFESNHREVKVKQMVSEQT